MAEILKVKDLCRDTILKDVSFTVDEGEFVAIVGPSGCGKTTMLSLLCGQLTESTGEILFRGKPLREHIDFHIGYMPQQDQLFEWRNIYGNVTLGLEIQKKLTAVLPAAPL